MALKKASERKVEGDYLDFRELSKEGPAVLFTVREIEDEEQFTNGPIVPVRARVIILSGARKGEVFPNERIISAGIINKLTEVGEDVVGRIRPYGARKNPGLEDEQEGDEALALAALEKHGTPGSSPAATEKTPVAASAPAGGTAEDEPEF